MTFFLRLPLFVILMGVGSVAMLVPAIHASVLDLDRVAQPFFYGAILFGVLTALIGLATVNRPPSNEARSHLATLVAAFLLLPIMLATPMREALPDASFRNVYFEMVSSFTTTGATVFDTPERLLPPLHLWRALVAWLGGFFILLTAIAVLAPLNLGGFEVLRPAQAAQQPEGRMQSRSGSERLLRFAIQLFPVYGAATALLWGCLMVSGTSPFLAICLAMSTLSTSGITPNGGFAKVDLGITGEALLFIFMVAAVSRQTFINDFNRSFLGRLRDDREMRMASFFVFMLPVALFIRHWLGALEIDEQGDFQLAIRAMWGALFTVLSFLTTTGFESADWSVARTWSGLPNPGLLLAGLAIIGGGVATTAGGVKLLRVYALYKHGTREMERLVHPHSIGGAGRLGREVRREGAYIAWIFFMLFAISIASVMIALAATGLKFDAALVFAVASLSTTGPLADVVLETGASYNALPGAAKTILIAAMVLGRLETLAIIALFNPDFWRS